MFKCLSSRQSSFNSIVYCSCLSNSLVQVISGNKVIWNCNILDKLSAWNRKKTLKICDRQIVFYPFIWGAALSFAPWYPLSVYCFQNFLNLASFGVLQWNKYLHHRSIGLTGVPSLAFWTIHCSVHDRRQLSSLTIFWWLVIVHIQTSFGPYNHQLAGDLSVSTCWLPNSSF